MPLYFSIFFSCVVVLTSFHSCNVFHSTGNQLEDFCSTERHSWMTLKYCAENPGFIHNRMFIHSVWHFKKLGSILRLSVFSGLIAFLFFSLSTLEPEQNTYCTEQGFFVCFWHCTLYLCVTHMLFVVLRRMLFDLNHHGYRHIRHHNRFTER